MDTTAAPSSRLPSSMPPKILHPEVRLLVVQPTPFCNIDCSYCYLPGRSSHATISDETLENLFAKLFSSGWVRRRVDVVWHAGEPTVLPLEFYRHAFAIIERRRPRDLAVVHGMQTNGTLLNAEWCQFFRSERINVGVSIDGPQRLNDLNRVSRSGRSTFAKAIAGLRLLRAERIPFHVITVLSNESLSSARELHDFYAAEGIEDVGFNVDESEGEHVSALQAGPAVAQAYQNFLAEFWAIAVREGKIRSIREIDQMLRAVGQNRYSALGNMLAEPFSVLSVDHSGNIATFSPELLGQINTEYDDYVIGNVNTHEFDQLPYSPVLARMHAEIQAGVSLCREQCGYFGVCGGGEPINKIAENGTFASSMTNFCRMTRMAIADLVAVGPHAPKC